jgi:hypothetical protein
MVKKLTLLSPRLRRERRELPPPLGGHDRALSYLRVLFTILMHISTK